MRIREVMSAAPVMPVIVLDHADDAVPLAQALVDGGIRVLEVTLRTPAALAAVAAIRAHVPGAIIGVGTVLDPPQFAAAAEAGAMFAVTPGLTSALAQAAADAALPLLPGVMTPSEVMAARAAGFDAMKLFPADQAGGAGMLRALAGPLPDILFCPTGGVGPDNAAALLALPNVGCVGGSWIAPRERIAARDWDGIRRLAAAAAALRP